MGVKLRKENYRVIVEPKDWGFISPRYREDSAMKAQCDGIIAGIKRHVDDVAHVYVECDTVRTCEHCGYAWTEESDEYNGGCCPEDSAVYNIDANWPDALERTCPEE